MKLVVQPTAAQKIDLLSVYADAIAGRANNTPKWHQVNLSNTWMSTALITISIINDKGIDNTKINT